LLQVPDLLQVQGLLENSAGQLLRMLFPSPQPCLSDQGFQLGGTAVLIQQPEIRVSIGGMFLQQEQLFQIAQ
jgi:hypothetical protein